MKFGWNEKKLQSKATKELVSIKDIVTQPQVFMNDGPMITYAIAEGILQLMNETEARHKVQKMLGGEAPEEKPLILKDGVMPEIKIPEDTAPKPKEPVEKQLLRLQNLVSLKEEIKKKLKSKEMFKYSAETPEFVKGEINLRVRQTLEQMLGEIDG